jgi:hypothetical protein
MEDDEFVEGQRLSPETLLPMPEMSLEQELLNTPVPFENRIALLHSVSIDTRGDKHTLPKLVDILGVSERMVRSILHEIQPPYEYSADEEIIYGAFTDEIMAEELLWQDTFNKLDEQISAARIAKTLNKGVDTVHQLANGLGVYPEFKTVGAKRLITYPKELAQMIRQISMHTPPAANWYNPTEAEDYIKKDRDWIVDRVEEYGLQTGMRLSRNNIMAPHYPLKTLEALRTLADQLPPPAGNWMTIHYMAMLLSKSSDWVESRIVRFSEIAEERLTDMNKVKKHYPPEVMDYIHELFINLPPKSNGWITVQEISRMLMKSTDWTSSRLDAMNESCEMRLDDNNEPRMHYRPTVVDEIQKEYLIYEEQKDSF